MIVRAKLLVAYLAAIIVCRSSLHTTTAFVGRQKHHRQYDSSLSTKGFSKADDSKADAAAAATTATETATNANANAAALTDFMAKAHEEKIAAMSRVEDKYRGQITELEDKIAELEALAKQTTPTSGNSFAFPATNKEMTDKVQAYRTFISDYIVKSQEEKSNAVKTAEATMSAKYEAIIDGLKAKE